MGISAPQNDEQCGSPSSLDTATLLHACAIAGEMGWGATVERGPGDALYTYFRDPDGHRVEIFNTHYQVMDGESEPIRWDLADTSISTPWGLPARAAWFVEATPFAGTAVEPPAMQARPAGWSATSRVNSEIKMHLGLRVVKPSALDQP